MSFASYYFYFHNNDIIQHFVYYAKKKQTIMYLHNTYKNIDSIIKAVYNYYKKGNLWQKKNYQEDN